MSHARAIVRRAAGYTAGKQPASADVIKLNTNENPYPPCAAVMDALRAVSADALRRYPPPLADGFRRVAAEVHGVGADNIVAVNGGDELLRLAITTFVDPGRPIGVIEPSYSLYPALAELHGSPVVRVEANPDWSLPADASRALDASGAELVFVVSPHAPSGHLTPLPALRELARGFRGVLVIDEAYVDFVDPALGHDATRLATTADNVLLLRTMSKGYSLAGLRFGYGIGHPDLVEPIRSKTRDSYNVDIVAQAVATAALVNREAARATWDRVRAERDEMRRALAALGVLTPPSESNFVLATVPSGGPTAAETCHALEARGILVRHFPAPRLDDKLRITIGTPDQNARLLVALGEILTLPQGENGVKA